MAGKEDTIKTKIVAEGEREYRTACKDINASLREIGSEMKLVSAEFAGNEESIDGLTAKQGVLNKRLEEQKKAVAAAEEVLGKFRGALDENDPAIRKMQTNLNNAKSEMVKTQNEIAKTAAVLKEAESGGNSYSKAVNEIDRQLKVLGAELKTAASGMELTSDKTEALGEKSKILSGIQEQQQRKVDALSEAYKKAAAETGQLSDESIDLKTRLEKAKQELNATSKEINDTDKALSEAESATSDFSDGLQEVTDEAGETGGALDGLDGKVSSMAGALGTGLKAFGTALAALGTAAVGTASALAGMTVSASNYADDILTMSADTRIAADDLQKYSYALNFIDGDINTLTKSMAKNIKSMDSARNGSAAYADAYKTLGVSVTDANGQLRDSETVYWECIDALGKVNNETERDALAMQLFGKSAQELNTVIDAGSEAFKAYGDEAEAMGAVMSDEALNSLGQFNDKLQVLNAGLGGLKNAAAMIALPFLDSLAAEGIPILASFTKGIQDANGDISKMADVIGTGLSDVLDLIVEKLPEFIEMGVTLVSSLIEGIVSNAPTIASAAVQIVETLVNGIATLLPMLIEGAAQLITGLATGLAQSLPTLIPTIVQVILQIVQTLIDNIPMLIDAALQLITGLAQGIINAIPVLVAALPTLITSLIDGLLAAIPQIIQAGIDLLTALVEALPEIIAAIVEAIPQIIDGIITALLESIPQIIQAGIDLLIALIRALPQIITTIVAALPQIITAICDALIGNIDQIIMAGVELFVALIENLPTIIVEIVKAVPQIIVGIVKAIGSLAYKLVEAGGNLLKGLWEGISNAASWLWEKVSGWASGLVDGIKDFFGIHSPSTVFAEIGTNMGKGVGVGFGDSMDGVSSDMTKAMGGAGQLTAAEAVRSVNDGIIANVDELSGAVNAIVERVITGLAAQAQKLNQVGENFDKNITSGMVTAIQRVITAIKSFSSQFTAAGEDMVRGTWVGFQNMSGWLESRVRSMMREIVAAVESEMQINSPSKVFAGIGAYMAQGLGVGFADAMRNVERTIRHETSNAVPNYTSGSTHRTDRRTTPTVSVTQNIYAQETSYARQQREAVRQFRQIAREVMA